MSERTIEIRIQEQEELIAMAKADQEGRQPGTQGYADRVKNLKDAEAWLVFLKGFKARQEAA